MTKLDRKLFKALGFVRKKKPDDFKEEWEWTYNDEKLILFYTEENIDWGYDEEGWYIFDVADRTEEVIVRDASDIVTAIFHFGREIGDKEGREIRSKNLAQKISRLLDGDDPDDI
jgi:hypothetical protein